MRALGLVIGLSFAVALGVACGQAPPPAAPSPAPATSAAGAPPPSKTAAATSTAAAAPAVPQRLVVGVTSVGNDADLLNPTFPFGYWKFPIAQVLTDLHSGDVKGQLAESFRVASPTSWEFTLRESRFANGDPVTAEDVKFSLDRSVDPANRYAVLLATASNIASTSVVSPKVVRVETKGPDPILPNRLTVFPILSKKLFESQGAERYNAAPVASGQYKLSRFNARQEAVIVPSEAYLGAKPNMIEVSFKEIPEQAARLAALQTGEIDLMDAVLVQNLSQLKSIGAREVLTPIGGISYLNVDTNAPQFAPVAVRRGLNLAIDRKPIIDALYGGLAQTASQPVPQTSLGFNPALPALTYDEAQAKRLLAEGGFANGFSTPLAYNPATAGNQQLAEALVPTLGRVGVRVELQPGDPSTFLQRLLSNQVGPFYITQFAQGAVQDPAGWMPGFLSMPPGNGRYRNPAYDALYAQQAGELDRTRRGQILQQVMKVLVDEPAGIYLWGSQGAWGANPRIGNFDRVPASTLPDWAVMTRR